MPTIYDIAKLTGYSPSTVSKAMNDYPHINRQTKEKILDCAHEIGFIPNFFAKSLMSKRSYLLGVLIDDELDSGLLHPFFGGVVDGFKRCIEARGYELLLIKTDYLSDGALMVEHCRQRGIEGVFMVISNLSNDGTQGLVESDIPCVTVDLYLDHIPSVLSDNELGGYMATKHLIGCGHRSIAHIAGNLTKRAGIDRLNGYLRAMQEAGLGSGLIANTDTYSGAAGEKAMKELFGMGQNFTAVFAASDTLAFGAMSVCEKMSLLVPRDMSVVGFDDIDSAAFFSPPLTTVRQKRKSIGNSAGELLISIIESDEPKRAEHIFMPVELVVRNSCSQPV